MTEQNIHDFTLTFAEGYLKSDSKEILNDKYKDEILSLYRNFLDESESISVNSSGSTGTPKTIYLPKKYMLNSADMTCSYLNIPEGASTLLCMPLKFIGAKMVVIRALLKKLQIVAVNPSSHPLKELKRAPYFAAMTPSQVFSSLENESEREILFNIKELIIGGGAVNSSLKTALMESENHIWSTYGMTETISHIALKAINVPSSKETGHVPFEGVSLSTANDGTLIIDAPYIGVRSLKTNDIVEFNADGSFNILGRADNIINSGGIKIQIEKLEDLIREELPIDFNITSLKSEQFGETVCLIATDSSLKSNGLSDEDVIGIVKKIAPKYWAPKTVIRTDFLPRTESGKPARAKIKALASALNKNN